jgi:hypothetical protein
MTFQAARASTRPLRTSGCPRSTTRQATQRSISRATGTSDHRIDLLPTRSPFLPRRGDSSYGDGAQSFP